MKIVWISHSGIQRGGAENSLVETVKALVALGHEAHVVIPSRGGLDRALMEAGASVSALPYVWWVDQPQWQTAVNRVRKTVRNLRVWPTLSKTLKASRPELVVSNTLTVPVGALAAKSAGIAHLWYIREFGKEDLNLSFDLGDRFSTSVIKRLSRFVIVNSIAVQTKFQKWIPAEKIRLNYPAVSMPVFPSRPTSFNGSLRLVLVGRTAPAKRQEDAIRAVSLLANKSIDVRLSLVGADDGEYAAFLRGLARDMNVRNRVRFIEFTKDWMSHVADAQVALMCSSSEAFGRTTIEAMKMGKPVVGASAGGTVELIKNDWNGMLYGPGRHEELADRIETLYHDGDLLRRMGSNAYEWSHASFNLEKSVNNLLGIFGEALSLNHSSSSRKDRNVSLKTRAQL